jgi:hypothetical protein
MATKLFKRLGGEPKAVIEADSEPVINGLVKAGVGLALMREDLALAASDPSSGIILVERGRPSTFLQVVYRTGRENDPAMRAIFDVLRELWSDADIPAAKHVSTAPVSVPRHPAPKPSASERAGTRKIPKQLPSSRGQRPTV